MPKYSIVDGDCHILEPTDIWETWLPKKYRDKAPKLVKDVDGGDAWQFAGSPDPDPIGLVTTPGLPWDQFRWTGVTYEQARASAQSRLGDHLFAVAWAQGRSMTPEQAMAAQGQALLPTPTPAQSEASLPMQSPALPAGLTAREVEVLSLLAQGWTDAQIAEHLVLSPRTVNRHTASLYSKLGVSSRAAATRYAIEHHVL